MFEIGQKHKRNNFRKSRWSTKFKGHFAGKSSKKWAARLASEGPENFETEAQGTARSKPNPEKQKKTLGSSLLQKA